MTAILKMERMSTRTRGHVISVYVRTRPKTTSPIIKPKFTVKSTMNLRDLLPRPASSKPSGSSLEVDLGFFSFFGFFFFSFFGFFFFSFFGFLAATGAGSFKTTFSATGAGGSSSSLLSSAIFPAFSNRPKISLSVYLTHSLEHLKTRRCYEIVDFILW
ncbi:MAG: hypothetical protein CMB58_000990 [Methanobacteriota archaeon]|nr:MAG: hypothetical protein CMB58_000990 [Euryarchaeota archaeon]